MKKHGTLTVFKLEGGKRNSSTKHLNSIVGKALMSARVKSDKQTKLRETREGRFILANVEES